MKARRKLPPVKQVRIRKGNHPSNSYAAEARTALRHEDRPGWPFGARKVDLSDETQLGRRQEPALEDYIEPSFELTASDPLSGMLVRTWANLAAELGLATAAELADARRTALAMDEWRRRNSGAGRAGPG